MDSRPASSNRFPDTLTLQAGTITTLLVASVILFHATAPQGFSIPDERAVWWQIERIRAIGVPVNNAPQASAAEGLIHPRSITIFNDQLVPEGFLGYGFWMGWLSRLVGLNVVWVVPPVLLGIAALLIGRTVRMFTRDERWAQATTSLLLMNPALLYYAFHSYSPNLTVSSLIAISVTILLSLSRQPHAGKSFLGAIALGLAWSMRSSEILWSSLLVIGVLAFHRPSWKMMMLATIGAMLPIIPILLLQQRVYGAWWMVGYTLNSDIATTLTGPTKTLQELLRSIFFILFPFGIHPLVTLNNLWQYTVWMFWFWFLLGIIGVMLVPWKRAQVLLRRTWIASMLWLILLYGSWHIVENANESITTISTSYVRYWLPLWFIASPLISRGWLALMDRFSRPTQWASTALLVVVSVIFITRTTPASLNTLRIESFRQEDRRAAVEKLTEPNAILLVKYSDKVYFPTRHVMVWYREPEKVGRVLPALVDAATVYLVEDDEEGEPMALPSSVRVTSTRALSPSERLHTLERVRIDRVPSSKAALATQHNNPVILPIPFTSQAPRGNWKPPYNEYCEEAATLMAGAYFHKTKLTPRWVERELHRLARIERKLFGDDKDTNAEQTAQLITLAYPTLDASVVPFSIPTIRASLAVGDVLIVPTAGRLLSNPFFRRPGPRYHMVVIRGLIDDAVIVNDPGTRRGEGFRYPLKRLADAAHDWNGGDVLNGKAVMILVSRRPVKKL